MPDEFTPEEYEQLAESPADSGVVLDDDATDPPEGVVGNDPDPAK